MAGSISALVKIKKTKTTAKNKRAILHRSLDGNRWHSKSSVTE